MKLFTQNIYIPLFVCMVSLFGACATDDLYPDPYGEAAPVIGIDFKNTPPSPSTGVAGQRMTFSVSGLTEYEDKVVFLANGMEAEVVGMTDSTVTIVLPENVSSGGTSLRVEGQIFPGPSFRVRGKLNVDPTFTPGVGANSLISQILPLPNGNFVLAGSFSSYQGRGLASQVSGLVQINPSGNYMSALRPGRGPSGGISSILRLPNGEFMVGGYFNSFNEVEGMNNIARLHVDASIRSVVVDLYVSPGVSDPSMSKDTVSAFNGSLIGGVSRLFYFNNQITAVGSINGYGQYFYERSTKNNKLFAATTIRQLARLDLNGNLDSTYNYNQATQQGLPATNGFIRDAYMQNDGKLILVGRFTSYNGTAANNIVRLNVDGSIDQTFTVGAGANDGIYTIRYNATTHKFVLTGSFSQFNGATANNMVLLNDDGSVHNGFSAALFERGTPTFAAQLQNGLVLVTGSFSLYNGIVREGLLVLNPDGTLAQGYNNTGKLNGIVHDMVETTSGIGNLPSVILTGFIGSFNGADVGNILKLTFNN